MKKITAIAAIVAAAQIVGSSAFADSSTGPDIEKAKESASVVKIVTENFPTRIVADSNLPNGIEVVIQEGALGERTFFKASESLLGNNAGNISVPIFYEEVTKLPTEKVVRKGTNAQVIEGISDKTKAAEKTKADAKVAAEVKKKADEAAAKESAKEIAQSEQPSAARSESSKSTTAPLSPAPSAGGVTSPEENKAYARSILSAADFSCTDQLAMRESGWSTTATNPSSGAYGVAQSLPAGKMASAGADWRTNGRTQVNWMISYMNERYGSPCNALAHSHSVGWY
jgi:hypothetical protein